MSTLCAGCGHDSITAAMVRALLGTFDAAPHMIAKMSGIGCSSKTPDLFRQRRARIQFGAWPHATHRHRRQRGQSRTDLHRHFRRRRLAFHRSGPHVPRHPAQRADVYVIENNGVYGLTKGQFSASADVGSKSKKGEPNRMAPIDPVMLGLSIGATFIARSFSGDKEQLVPILKAADGASRFRAGGRDFSVRDFQRSQGIDQELSVHAPARDSKATEADFVPPAVGDSGEYRPERRRQRGDARRKRGAISKASRRTTIPRDREKVIGLPAGASGQRRGSHRFAVTLMKACPICTS